MSDRDCARTVWQCRFYTVSYSTLLLFVPLLRMHTGAGGGKVLGPGATRGAAGPTAAMVAAGGRAGVAIAECVAMRDELLNAGRAEQGGARCSAVQLCCAVGALWRMAANATASMHMFSRHASYVGQERSVHCTALH